MAAATARRRGRRKRAEKLRQRQTGPGPAQREPQAPAGLRPGEGSPFRLSVRTRYIVEAHGDPVADVRTVLSHDTVPITR